MKTNKPFFALAILGTLMVGMSLSFEALSSVPERTPAVSVIGSVEIVGIWGGDCDPCKQSKSCTAGFKSGTNKCAKCSGGPTYFRCCDLGDGTTCEYQGTSSCSGNSLSGDISGTPGTCLSCTSTSFDEGSACALESAIGGNCP